MVADAFEELRYELEEAIDVGDGRLLALVRIRGRGKGSGVGVDTRLAHLWTVRDGKAVRMQAFTDRDEARRAAGLA